MQANLLFKTCKNLSRNSDKTNSSMENSIEGMEFDDQFAGSSLCMLNSTLEFDSKNPGSVSEKAMHRLVLLEVLSLGS